MKINIFKEFFDLLKTENIPFENGRSNIIKWEENLYTKNLGPKYLRLLNTLKFLGILSIEDFIYREDHPYTSEWRVLLSLKLDQISIKNNILRTRTMGYLPLQQIAEEYITAFESGQGDDYIRSHEGSQQNLFAVIKNYLLTKDDSEIDKMLLKSVFPYNLKNKNPNTTISISFEFFLGNGFQPLMTKILLDSRSFKSFHDFLDYLFTNFLSRVVEARSYNKSWILYNYKTGNFLTKGIRAFKDPMPIDNGDILIVFLLPNLRTLGMLGIK